MKWQVSWRTRWLTAGYVRNSVWLIPMLCVTLAVGLGFAMPAIDRHTTVRIGIDFSSTAASGVLGAIAAGMITFTGFVFSIIPLVIQFGSSQFSPRMLRRFARDPITKLALGTFIATFIYALMVFREVGSSSAHFVPSNSVSVALYLLFLSMVMFLRLVGRTTQSLRVATVLRELGRDGERIVRRTYPDQLTDSVAQAEHPDADGVAGAVRTIVHRFDSGVLQSIGIAEIVDHACAVDMTVELVPRIGDVVATGSDIFRVRGGGGPADDARLQRAIAVGDERTIRQDPEFVFRLLADVSIKALSLAVNDPTTAVQALDQIELLLRDLGGRRLDTGVVRDAHGIVRIRRKVPSWEDFVTLALVETRQYGVASTQVTRRLRAILISLRDLVAEPRRRVLEAELAAIDTSIIHRFESEYDQRLAKVADTQGLG